jgi:hypothetical protein
MATGLTLESYLKNNSSVKAARKKLDAANKKLKTAQSALNSSRYAGADVIKNIQTQLNTAQSEYDQAQEIASKLETEATDYFKKNYQEITSTSAKGSLKELEAALPKAKSQVEAQAIQKSIDEAKAKIENPQPYVEPPVKKVKSKSNGTTGTGDITESINTDLDAQIANARQFLFDLKEPGRKQLAQTLKDAGFPVKVEGKFPNDTLLNYYVNSLKSVKSQNETNKDVEGYVPVKWDSYVADLIKFGTGEETKLDDPFGTQQIYNKSTAEGVIDNLFQTILKRDASQSEIDSLFKELRTEQNKLSSMSKGTYKMVNGRKVLVKEEGLDPRVFLENKIKELPAYKESLAAKSEQNKLSLASTALANGYDLERDFGTQLPNWLDAINKGESISKFQSTIRNSARLALPEAVRNSIDPNEDLTTSFATYISNFAKTFGMPVNQVSLSKIIPMATNEKGFVPIYDFEKKKRQLAEWDLTPDARTETANVVSTVLKDFGFKG